jgi:hypothetical protein
MIRRLEDGIPKNALREIKALQEIDVHENIVTLRCVCVCVRDLCVCVG